MTSAVIFLFVMLADFHWGFMTHLTPLKSGANSDLFISTGLLTVLTLGFLEGILGIDNATVLAIQVKHLKPADAHKALTWGVWGAFLFRFVFLVFAGYILQQKWIMAIGGFYLLNMAADFFYKNVFLFMQDMFVLFGLMAVFYITSDVITISDKNIQVWIFFIPLILFIAFRFHRQIHSKRKKDRSEGEGIKISHVSIKRHPVLSAVIAVEWTDILFSFDSIGAGLGMTRDFWVLFWGAFFGVTCLRLFAKQFVKLLDKYPNLETGAMIALMIVGIKMTFEAVQEALHLHYLHIHNWHTSVIIMGVFLWAFYYKGKPKVHIRA